MKKSATCLSSGIFALCHIICPGTSWLIGKWIFPANFWTKLVYAAKAGLLKENATHPGKFFEQGPVQSLNIFSEFSFGHRAGKNQENYQLRKDEIPICQVLFKNPNHLVSDGKIRELFLQLPERAKIPAHNHMAARSIASLARMARQSAMHILPPERALDIFPIFIGFDSLVQPNKLVKGAADLCAVFFKPKTIFPSHIPQNVPVFSKI
jgi:hypothetical protein